MPSYKQPRTVFGRRRIVHDGIETVIELRKDGIFVRELRARREDSLSLSELVDVLRGQNIIRVKNG